jgi:hypothetical protein
MRRPAWGRKERFIHIYAARPCLFNNLRPDPSARDVEVTPLEGARTRRALIWRPPNYNKLYRVLIIARASPLTAQANWSAACAGHSAYLPPAPLLVAPRRGSMCTLALSLCLYSSMLAAQCMRRRGNPAGGRPARHALRPLCLHGGAAKERPTVDSAFDSTRGAAVGRVAYSVEYEPRAVPCEWPRLFRSPHCS